jgi:hypothetical protein
MGDGCPMIVASTAMAYAVTTPITMAMSQSHCTAHHEGPIREHPLTDFVFRGPTIPRRVEATLLPKWSHESAYCGTRHENTGSGIADPLLPRIALHFHLREVPSGRATDGTLGLGRSRIKS